MKGDINNLLPIFKKIKTNLLLTLILATMLKK